ncbi:MAG TPA: substrate-binding domain-containing protein [Solirubrobacteraceae bacterium]|jgi:phosphate transport system substrate-binding protein|nr:substrate-binding domain-containing protein [Solirubrobacteraceae bacterium]
MNQHRRLRLRLAIAVAAVGVLGAAAAPTIALAAPTISISGATASYPLVSLLAQKYVKLKRGTVKFKIAQGGAQIGINDVASSRVSIGDVSRDPLPTDPKGLVFYPIAKYGICVVTNKSNTLGSLTPSQLVSIFTGKTRNWSQVPGASASGTIDLISRTSVAGVLTSFQTLLLEGKKVSSLASEQSSEGLLRQAVESDPSSIGFLSNYQAALGSLNSVSYNGVACNRSTVASGSYAGIARFYEVTRGPAQSFVASFISWITKSAAAHKIIESQWVPITG